MKSLSWTISVTYWVVNYVTPVETSTYRRKKGVDMWEAFIGGIMLFLILSGLLYLFIAGRGGVEKNYKKFF
ncbi:hypothetical protein LCGC14_3048500 [marine sediment metagenome]|uniref:Uncharacterized protein n=1 Tax=marine sediment metagenome TaxID=412755 RepID=A0A0F8ZDC4_9ZZZZ